MLPGSRFVDASADDSPQSDDAGGALRNANERTMRIYDRYLLPRLTHWVCSSPAVQRQRRRVVPRAYGRVLEVGFGSGLNLPHYTPAQVKWIWAVEPSAPMYALAKPRILASGLDVRCIAAVAEQIPLPDASADSAVLTFCLCTVADPAAALREIRRVLQPGGPLHFSEHGAAPDPGVRQWQDRLNGVWGRLAGGCHLNRSIVHLIEASGFRLDEVQSDYMPKAPRFAGYVSRGVARSR
jgi:ubiquinone/menaquinone biosynthesis C-methylase UbiE